MNEKLPNADHCGTDCPQCMAFSEQSKALGGLAESIQKMLDDGTFHRLGAEMARRREEAVFRAFFGVKGKANADA